MAGQKKNVSAISQAEQLARSRAMKGNPEMAQKYGIDQDYVRELVKVDSLPDPPPTEPMVQAQSSRQTQTAPELTVLSILNDAIDEMQFRFSNLGIIFSPQMKQDLIDHTMTLIALQQSGQLAGGGVLARR
jgi:hypothetical protein